MAEFLDKAVRPAKDAEDAAIQNVDQVLTPSFADEGEDLRVSTVSHESQSYFALVWRRFRRSVSGMLGLTLVVVLLLVAVFADFVYRSF